MVAGCITAQSQHPVLGHDFFPRRQMTLHETTLEGDSTESALLDTPIASNSPISASTDRRQDADPKNGCVKP